jgi:LTXXQ motif family protein
MSKRTLVAAGLIGAMAIAAYTIAPPASAQMGWRGGYGPGSGPGPGMMNGPGYGPGMMGPGYGPGRGGGWGMMGGGCGVMGTRSDGRAETFVNGRIAFLKAELGITDVQKAAWNAYADALKRNLQSMQGMWQTMQAVFEAKTPVEGLDARVAAMESRLTALKEVKPALAGLYAALSDDQKKKADELLTGMGCMM